MLSIARTPTSKPAKPTGKPQRHTKANERSGFVGPKLGSGSGFGFCILVLVLGSGSGANLGSMLAAAAAIARSLARFYWIIDANCSPGLRARSSAGAAFAAAHQFELASPKPGFARQANLFSHLVAKRASEHSSRRVNRFAENKTIHSTKKASIHLSCVICC